MQINLIAVIIQLVPNYIFPAHVLHATCFIYPVIDPLYFIFVLSLSVSYSSSDLRIWVRTCSSDLCFAYSKFKHNFWFVFPIKPIKFTCKWGILLGNHLLCKISVILFYSHACKMISDNDDNIQIFLKIRKKYHPNYSPLAGMASGFDLY